MPNKNEEIKKIDERLKEIEIFLFWYEVADYDDYDKMKIEQKIEERVELLARKAELMKGED